LSKCLEFAKLALGSATMVAKKIKEKEKELAIVGGVLGVG
jgi:hypothetical protein